METEWIRVVLVRIKADEAQQEDARENAQVFQAFGIRARIVKPDS